MWVTPSRIFAVCTVIEWEKMKLWRRERKREEKNKSFLREIISKQLVASWTGIDYIISWARCLVNILRKNVKRLPDGVLMSSDWPNDKGRSSLSRLKTNDQDAPSGWVRVGGGMESRRQEIRHGPSAASAISSDSFILSYTGWCVTFC